MEATVQKDLDRAEAVANLARFRETWQQGAEISLLDAQASVGLLLLDVTLALGLSSAEQRTVLGEDLRREAIRAIRAQ